RTVMARNAKVVDPHLNWGEQVKSIGLEVDQDRARALGLTPQDVSQMLQTLLTGYTVTQYREGIEHIDVVARAVPSERLDLDRLETGGAIEESAKANGALVAVFPAMAIAMLGLLMVQLQSFSRLALVFATAPLGLIGATGALLLSNRPFGFVALLGLIALAGMIMRNTVILVDQIDRDIAAGHGRQRAIIGATVRRARPVVLTALAAVQVLFRL